MRLMDFFPERAVSCDLKAGEKEGVLRELIGLLVRAGSVKEKDADRLTQVLLEREALGSTGIGHGVAIPHGKSHCVNRLICALGLSKQGMNFDALDGDMVHIFFLLVAPEDSAGPHLKALARISRLLKDKHFRESLLAAKDEKVLLKMLREEDERRPSA
jgi:PTS system nitrogen regulatory IIA component